ncbi:MAG: hypothetical protein LBD04_02005 [Synergistaceae bacterium]|jgi:hypothetical protein|nr:hypothetical protein [Synergistaceae bacterium]
MTGPNDDWTALRQDAERHLEEIWLDEPRDVASVRSGRLPSGAGIYGQYFSVLVMLGGEMRALGVHIFSDLLKFMVDEAFTLPLLRKMIWEMLAIDAGVVGYFGLRDYGALLVRYRDISQAIEDREALRQLTESMFSLTNRYQMWMHHIFPWGLSEGFKKEGECMSNG